MYLVKTPSLLKPLARDLVWNIPSEEKVVYLTFDDGPIPEVTERVLDLLHQYNAKATFFCLGKNVEANPLIYARILREGHATGNHSFDHPDGWKTENLSYLRNIIRASKLIATDLFRPPYGRITPAQVQALKKRYRIVMWDVLSADFDTEVTPEECFQNVIHHADSGSIVVFHDSIKAANNMLFALEESLKYFRDEGYILRAIS